MSQRVQRGTVREAFPDTESGTVRHNPTTERLREFARQDEQPTEYGSPSYVSEQKSRSADRTKNLLDDEFSDADWAAIDDALAAAQERDLVSLDRRVGHHPETSYTCRLFVPREYARIALAWGKLLEPAPDVDEPDFKTLQLPEWDTREGRQRRIRVLPDEGVTFVLGSDYTGEAKKSFLRLFMFRAKYAGGLGLHAGTKRVTIAEEGDTPDEESLRTVGQAFLGLSATGKSTLTGHGCWLDSPEGAEMLQDDVCALLPNGQVTGSEGAGLYIKTDGLDPEEQPSLCRAATHESAVLENVTVEEDGTVDFDDTELTSNGRAVVSREQLDSAAEDTDLESVDQVFFITRNPLMPPVARLTPRQAAVAFMLGESIQTSAGDPDAAGESIRVVGTNPFIVGPEGEEGNRFYELVAANDIECFLLNTGHVGPSNADIGVRESVRILVCAARDDIAWHRDDTFGFEVPTSVPGVDIDAFYPPAQYDDFESELAALRDERRAYLASFEALDDDIKESVY
jgi:phosphoenolpyruvate carboxykinase (ATP)